MKKTGYECRSHGHIPNFNSIFLWQSPKYYSLFHNHACLRIKTYVPHILLIHISAIKDEVPIPPESQGRRPIVVQPMLIVLLPQRPFFPPFPPIFLGRLLLENGGQIALVRGTMKGNQWLWFYGPHGKSVPFLQGCNFLHSKLCDRQWISFKTVVAQSSVRGSNVLAL